MKKTLFSLLTIGIAVMANDEVKISPFGITINDTLHKSIKYTTIENSDMLMVTNPPNPIKIFDGYGVLLNNLNKVSIISAIGNIHENDNYCYTSQEEFKEIENLLIKKYGKPTTNLDYIDSEALWKESKYYKMSIINKERLHINIWKSIKKFPNIEVSLQEKATKNGCYIHLIYTHKELNKKITENKSKYNSDSL